MKEVIEKVISKSDGWRQGSGPAVCSGVIIDGTCYWIPKNYVSASQMDDACASSMNGGEPAVSRSILDLSDRSRTCYLKTFIGSRYTKQVRYGPSAY